MAKKTEHVPNHHVISAVVSLVAVVALVVIFQGSGSSGQFVAMSGDTNDVDWSITREFRDCPESDINCHPLNCRLTPDDDNYKLCGGDCPRGSPANPGAFTGNCCAPTNGDFHCETFREFAAGLTNTRRLLCSPTQGVCF